MAELRVEGGCLCGGVRYRLASEPYDAGWCHCRTCQLNSGSPAMAFATVPIKDFVLLSGTELVGSVASSQTGERRFCKGCGTPLLMHDKGGATVDFSLATLDEPGRVQPGFHIYYDSRIGWAEAGDDLPRYPRSRRDSGGG